MFWKIALGQSRVAQFVIKAAMLEMEADGLHVRENVLFFKSIILHTMSF